MNIPTNIRYISAFGDLLTYRNCLYKKLRYTVASRMKLHEDDIRWGRFHHLSHKRLRRSAQEDSSQNKSLVKYVQHTMANQKPSNLLHLQ